MAASRDQEAPEEPGAELLKILMQFRADGEKIGGEPVWAERVAEIFSQLPQEVLTPLASRIKEAVAKDTRNFEEFCKRHGLTPAEQKLVTSIADGMSVPEHAAACGISVNTARVHMQRVLEKTRTSRQTDLLRKLLKP